MRRPGTRARRGSVLLFILGATLFLAAVVAVIMKYAIVEMKLRAPVVMGHSLRQDAFNCLYAAIAELKEYLEIDGGLYAPAQGWGSLLKDGRAGLPEGLSAEVAVVDETGKLPLSSLNEDQLEDLLYEMGFSEPVADEIAQLFLDWTDSDDIARTYGAEKDDYERGVAVPPNRMVRSFSELKYIRGFGEFFFGPDGEPNEMFLKFASAVSLENTSSEVNFNTASELVLRALYRMDDLDLDNSIMSAIKGETGVVDGGIYWLTSKDQITSRGASPPTRFVGVSARFIRIEVRVGRGVSNYRVTALCEVSEKSISVKSIIEGARR